MYGKFLIIISLSGTAALGRKKKNEQKQKVDLKFVFLRPRMCVTTYLMHKRTFIDRLKRHLSEGGYNHNLPIIQVTCQTCQPNIQPQHCNQLC